jgi:cytosine/adenosine deaminase-related metal-dependent hydrolase
MRYLSAHYVFPVSSPPLQNGIVCVNGDGCIVDVIDSGGKPEKREKIEFYSGILVPGFVNAHCHLELSHLRDAIKPGGGLPDFITSVGRLRKANRETILAAAKSADEEMMENGIAVAGDVSNHADTLGVKRNSRICYHTFVEIFGLDGNRAKETLATAEQVKQEFCNAGTSASVAPHAVYSVSRALWEELYQSYQSSPPHVISMHHRESSEETGVYPEGKGELADMLRKNGLLTGSHIPCKEQMMRCFRESSRCLLVHNVFLSENDLPEYASAPDRFYFVLCPRSNLYIQNRLPDLQLFSSPELYRNVCLGTDSLASNTSLSILDEMKVIQQHAPHISLEMLVRWATFNGASALGSPLHGSFEKGKTPGVNLITEIDFDRMRLTAESTVKVLVDSGKR